MPTFFSNLLVTAPDVLNLSKICKMKVFCRHYEKNVNASFC